MLAVAYTGPLNYLILIGEADLLPRLFGMLAVPDIVSNEMRHPLAPDSVRAWIESPPAWLEICPMGDRLPDLPLDAGERAAIALALTRHADLILMDDRRAVVQALAQGLAVVGTLGVLDRAARRSLVDLPQAIARLRATNFRCRPEILDALLAERGGRT